MFFLLSTNALIIKNLNTLCFRVAKYIPVYAENTFFVDYLYGSEYI